MQFYFSITGKLIVVNYNLKSQIHSTYGCSNNRDLFYNSKQRICTWLATNLKFCGLVVCLVLRLDFFYFSKCKNLYMGSHELCGLVVCVVLVLFLAS